ncbi:mCG147414 [Mus musculus]|jgi:hypothetical protein|nr:mCG147414 [Mus musculus]
MYPLAVGATSGLVTLDKQAGGQKKQRALCSLPALLELTAKCPDLHHPWASLV